LPDGLGIAPSQVGDRVRVVAVARPEASQLREAGPAATIATATRDRIEENQDRLAARRWRLPCPPPIEGIRRVRADGSEAGEMRTDRAKSLGGREHGHHMSLTAPLRDTCPSRDLGAEEASLAVEGAERFLKVGEASAVLDMEQRRALRRPDDHVRPSGELKVLERLIHSDVESELAEVVSLRLTHSRVHGVRRMPARRSPASRVAQVELHPQPQCLGQSDVRLE
jgi:hypothetical protein